jgi:hypothetical protein
MKIHRQRGVGGFLGCCALVKNNSGKKRNAKQKQKEDCGRLAHQLSPFWQLQTHQQFKTKILLYYL